MKLIKEKLTCTLESPLIRLYTGSLQEKKRRHNFNDTIVALSYLWKKGDSLDTTVKQGHIQENDEEGERKKRTLADWAEIRALCTDPAD